jgi:hypothetical protein
MERFKTGVEQVRSVAADWTAVAGLASFVLYLFGYLSLRFQLYAHGVNPELAILDERYLFAGGRFLVFLFSAVPSVLLLALVAVAVLYLPYWMLPRGARAALAQFVADRATRARAWWSAPGRLAFAGVVLSVLFIQLVMKQCYYFSNLLLRHALPEPGWLQAILLDDTGALETLYFGALLAGTAVVAGFLAAAQRAESASSASRLLVTLLWLLVAVQFLLLPVNYGIIVAGKVIPRVVDVDGLGAAGSDEEAWLVYEGNESSTYLVRRGTARDHRSLLTVSRKAPASTRIVSHDPIFRVLFLNEPVETDAVAAGERKPQP